MTNPPRPSHDDAARAAAIEAFKRWIIWEWDIAGPTPQYLAAFEERLDEELRRSYADAAHDEAQTEQRPGSSQESASRPTTLEREAARAVGRDDEVAGSNPAPGAPMPQDPPMPEQQTFDVETRALMKSYAGHLTVAGAVQLAREAVEAENAKNAPDRVEWRERGRADGYRAAVEACAKLCEAIWRDAPNERPEYVQNAIGPGCLASAKAIRAQLLPPAQRSEENRAEAQAAPATTVIGNPDLESAVPGDGASPPTPSAIDELEKWLLAPDANGIPSRHVVTMEEHYQGGFWIRLGDDTHGFEDTDAGVPGWEGIAPTLSAAIHSALASARPPSPPSREELEELLRLAEPYTSRGTELFDRIRSALLRSRTSAKETQ